MPTAWIDDSGILEAAPDDYELISSRLPVRARGSDGVIAAGSFDLSSATNDFAAQGVAAGHVLILNVGGSAGGDATLPPDSPFIVEGVAGHTVTLRQPGLSAGEGLPPGGWTDRASLKFKVPTFATAIRDSQDWLKQRYAVADDDDPDAPDFGRALTLSVLVDRYAAAATSAGTTSDGDNYKAKRDFFAAELDAELARLDGREGGGVGVFLLPSLGLQSDPDDLLS